MLWHVLHCEGNTTWDKAHAPHFQHAHALSMTHNRFGAKGGTCCLAWRLHGHLLHACFISRCCQDWGQMGQNLMSAITKVSIDLPSSLTLSAKTRLVRFRVPTTPRKRRHELFNILHFALDFVQGSGWCWCEEDVWRDMYGQKCQYNAKSFN